MAASQASFNVGHDVTVTVLSPITGALITFNKITDFHPKAETKALESSPLSAPPEFGDVPHGWSGTFTIDRHDSGVDDFFAALEAAYWNGTYITSGEVNEFFQETNGTVSQYKYVGCAFKFDNAGSRTSQGKVTMSVSFRCSQRKKIV